MRKLSLFLIFLIGLAHSTMAQKEIIKLWSGHIPGSRKDISYIEESVKGDDDITRVYKVTEPEMIVYPAVAEKSTGGAVIICPGGGYHILAIDHEGFYMAEWLSKIGITAFVLKYRLPNDRIMEDKSNGPLLDAKRAIEIVRKNSKKWNINPGKIGIMGFSAGGHLASSLSTHFNDDMGERKTKVSLRPDFSILIYPVISMERQITHMGSRNLLLGKSPSKELVEAFSNDQRVNKNTPPAFLVHAADDTAVSVQNSINYFTALKSFGIPAEIHIYEKGGHGFGIRNLKGTVAYWPDTCENWLRMHRMIK